MLQYSAYTEFVTTYQLGGNMLIHNIDSVCSGLMDKARAEHFLDHSVKEIENQANNFVEDFAKENGLTAHTLSAFRWYFQTNDHLLEDGFVELHCKMGLLNQKGHCTFDVVDIANVDRYKHSYL